MSGSRIPAFVIPDHIIFYTDDPSTHKSVVTLYNPYDFPISYKVLCTKPRKYSIIDSEGHLRKKSSIDIVIRHKEIGLHNEGVQDKIRIQIYEEGLKKTVAGKRDVSLLLLKSKPKDRTEDETFENMPASAAAMQRGPGSEAGTRQWKRDVTLLLLKTKTSEKMIADKILITIPAHANANPGPNKVAILALIISGLLMCLPHMESTGHIAGQVAYIPDWVYITFHYKLLAGVVLGLAACAILRY